MTTRPWVIPTLLATALFFACPKREASAPASSNNAAPPAASAAAPAPSASNTAPASTLTSVATPGGVASADGEKSGVKVVVQELKRTSGGTISMKFTIVNTSDKKFGFGYDFGDADHSVADYNSVGGVHLVDEAGKKKYFVVRDTEGKCICSRDVKELKPGENANLWARFPAPPDDVQKIAIVIPHFQPMDDVPLSK